MKTPPASSQRDQVIVRLQQPRLLRPKSTFLRGSSSGKGAIAAMAMLTNDTEALSRRCGRPLLQHIDSQGVHPFGNGINCRAAYSFTVADSLTRCVTAAFRASPFGRSDSAYVPGDSESGRNACRIRSRSLVRHARKAQPIEAA